MAVSTISTCSSSCENSTLKDGDNDPKILKCSLLSLSGNDLIWEGDLESLKRFVETELQMNGRWSTPRGENFKFSNPEFSLKWDGTTDKKIAVIQDNDENQLYTTLRSYATLTKSAVDENRQEKTEHILAMASYDTKADKTTTTESDEKKHACEQCNIYKEDITKLLAVVTEIQNKQDVECQITAETDAKIKVLLDQNDKMAAELASLKTTVEEITNENKVIRCVLDLKQHEWTKVETTSGKSKETEQSEANKISVESPNRYQALHVDNVNVEDLVHDDTSNVDNQISDYRNKQVSKFQNMKKNNHKKSNEAKKKTAQNTIQERNVLLIGDSMVKNIDYKKLERAARKKTVCHSYSGAKVGQIKEKIDEYWSENHQYEQIIIHVGTNDLVHKQPEKVAEEMETLIDRVKAHTKKVAVSSVVKRYDNKVNASNISRYNNLLQELCIKHKIAFINNEIKSPLK